MYVTVTPDTLLISEDTMWTVCLYYLVVSSKLIVWETLHSSALDGILQWKAFYINQTSNYLLMNDLQRIVITTYL